MAYHNDAAARAKSQGGSRGTRSSKGSTGAAGSKGARATGSRAGGRTPAARAVAPRPEPTMPDDPRAGRIVLASWIGTALLVVTAVPAAVAPHTFVAPAVFVSLALFVAGTVAFLWAYFVAIGRSRRDLIGMGGLFFLAGSAPAPVQRSLWASLGVEVAVAVATAAARPFTPLAFGVLAPMYGLGVMGLWGARFGTFPPRPPDPEPPRRRRAAPAD